MGTRLKLHIRRYAFVLVLSTLAIMMYCLSLERKVCRPSRELRTGNTTGLTLEQHFLETSNQEINTSGSHPTTDEEYHKSLWSNGNYPDVRFAPLLKLFQQKANGDLKPKITKFRSGSMPRVLLWSRPFRGNFWDAQFNHVTKGLCPLPCEVTYNVEEKETVDAIIIYLRGARNDKTVMEHLSPRDPRQPWIVLNYESPVLANSVYHTRYSVFNRLFNRTMFYHQDSDILTLQGFVIPKEDQYIKVLPKTWIQPGLSAPNSTLTKKLAISIISDCKASSNRLDYIHKMQQYGPVDMYGRCGTLKCGHRMFVTHRYFVPEDRCLKSLSINYLFYLAFENNFCDDYFTEKVFNFLYFPLVPVIRAQADFKKILPPNSYIDASGYSPKELMEKMLYLQNNPAEYNKLLEWRKYYQMSTLGGERSMCYLCSRLYDPDIYEHKVIEDFEDWFVGKSHCSTPMKL